MGTAYALLDARLTMMTTSAATAWDWEIGLGCAECEASLWEDDDRAFSYAPRSYLCHDCASCRGGVYDTRSESWVTPPDVRGLR